MRVRLLRAIPGRHGADRWPPPGTEIEVSDALGRYLIASRLAAEAIRHEDASQGVPDRDERGE